jgi:hypothetical protein
VIERETDVTVAEYWGTLDDAAKRDYLLRAEIKIYATRDEYTPVGDWTHIKGVLTLAA